MPKITSTKFLLLQCWGITSTNETNTVIHLLLWPRIWDSEYSCILWTPLLFLIVGLSMSAHTRLGRIWKVIGLLDIWQRIGRFLLYIIYILLVGVFSLKGHFLLPDVEPRCEMRFSASQHSSCNIATLAHYHSNSAVENCPACLIEIY